MCSLTAGASIHAQNDQAFRWAVGNRHIDLARLLLDRDTDIHTENDYALRMVSLDGAL